jgi:HSP20 family protein
LLHLQSTLDQMIGRSSFGADYGVSSASVYPPVNVFVDAEGGLVVRAEIPGVEPSKVEITAEPRRLTISGERAAAPESAKSAHRRERSFGRFSRALQLPDNLDTKHVRAESKHGILTITIRKAEAAKPRRIEVESA